MSTKTKYVPYKAKDMSLAEWGRQEIKLADYIGVKVEGPFKPEHYRY